MKQYMVRKKRLMKKEPEVFIQLHFLHIGFNLGFKSNTFGMGFQAVWPKNDIK